MSSEVSGAPLPGAPDGVPLLQAPLLTGGIAHAFSTRVGGVSAAPFATLNLGRAVGDDPPRVEANRRRVLAALGRDPGGHVEASQVHGRTVAVVGRRDRGAKIGGADALLTEDSGLTLAIHTADCVPILLWDARRGVAGAAHAGWRGTAAGLAAVVVETMTRVFRIDPADLRVALGPAIGPCHYEVDAPVVEAFRTWPWAESVLRPGRPGHWWLDLPAANRFLLLAAGVPVTRIWTSGLCTACDPRRFFSHRRDGTTGRMGALIGLV